MRLKSIMLMGAFAVLAVPVFGVMSEAQVRSALFAAFGAYAGEDDIDLDQQAARESMSFDERFPGLLDSSGWTRHDIMACTAELLNEALTNGAAVVTDKMSRFTYEQAITVLARYGETNSLPVLAYGIRHPGAFQWPNGFLNAYIAIAGGNDAAISDYARFVCGPNALNESGRTALYGAMRSAHSASRFTAADRRGLDRFVLLRSYDQELATPAIDRYLCSSLTNYLRSTLRKDAVNRYVAAQSHVSYFLPIQAQLNAATNLVELATNDFLNAGE